MDRNQLQQFLQSSGIINAIKAGQIAEHFDMREIENNGFFLEEGKVSNEYMILTEGFMRAFSIDVDGNEVTTAFYSSIRPVFEVASFFNRTPSKENIQAITPARGWVVDYEKLNKLFHTMPEFREFGRSVLVNGFSALKTRMLSMITETAEERYVRMLSQNPEIFQQASLKQIASYLGITDTSLSRIRKEMMKRNT